MTINITAIAKNENRFIAEWIAHHLALGFESIRIYDNESSDGMSEALQMMTRHFPVSVHHWPHRPGESPQATAYADALEKGDDWVAFLDLDEFLVFENGRTGIKDFVQALPDDVSAVGFNWVTFGTSGQKSKQYGLVRDTFSLGPTPELGNNKHIKTLCRPRNVAAMGIHAARLRSGRYVKPSGEPLVMVKPGVSRDIEHSVAYVNHYQIKSEEDFREKMARGRAGTKTDDRLRFRAADQKKKLFKAINRADAKYSSIQQNRSQFLKVYGDILACLAA